MAGTFSLSEPTIDPPTVPECHPAPCLVQPADSSQRQSSHCCPFQPTPPPPPCISSALVQATLGVGTVIIVYVILIAYKIWCGHITYGFVVTFAIYIKPWTYASCHMQGKFIPKNFKLPEPKPAPKPQPKASSSGQHVQLFRMVYDRKKGFQAEHL